MHDITECDDIVIIFGMGLVSFLPLGQTDPTRPSEELMIEDKVNRSHRQTINRDKVVAVKRLRYF